MPTLSTNKSISPFVSRCLSCAELDHALPVLDIPCGRGRHSHLLSDLGYDVVGIDIDMASLVAMMTRDRQPGAGEVLSVKADARNSLPFCPRSFGLALIIHFVSDGIIPAVGALIAPGGYLIYETFGSNGGNWLQLQNPGEAKKAAAAEFDILAYEERPAVRPGVRAAAVKLFARKKE